MAECIFCLKHFLETEKPTTLSQKGVDGIVKVNSSRAIYKRKVFPSVGNKVINNSIPGYHNALRCTKCVTQSESYFFSRFSSMNDAAKNIKKVPMMSN